MNEIIYWMLSFVVCGLIFCKAFIGVEMDTVDQYVRYSWMRFFLHEYKLKQ